MHSLHFKLIFSGIVFFAHFTVLTYSKNKQFVCRDFLS